jgi:hypothetical protein
MYVGAPGAGASGAPVKVWVRVCALLDFLLDDDRQEDAEGRRLYRCDHDRLRMSVLTEVVRGGQRYHVAAGRGIDVGRMLSRAARPRPQSPIRK